MIPGDRVQVFEESYGEAVEPHWILDPSGIDYARPAPACNVGQRMIHIGKQARNEEKRLRRERRKKKHSKKSIRKRARKALAFAAWAFAGVE